jgi:ABC-type bacteriocin/lantibiotic exporter with double-glycine peptidase domain
MNAFHRPDLPASSKVLSLVRLHHGMPPEIGEVLPATAKASAPLGRLWRSGARANHLQARRRRVPLDDLPEAEFPVILELAGGSNFVIVHERSGTEGEGQAYRVQFPDSREAEVRADRLRELYDGTCVFLSPGTSALPAGLFPRLRRRLGWAC